MSEIRFLTSSDEHISDQNPAFRKDNYREAVLSKLKWQNELANALSVTAILRAGDLFHNKAANRTSMGTIIDLMSIFNASSCQNYSIVGNHDIVYSDISTLSRQPLGVLFESKCIKRLTNNIFYDGTLAVRVIGIDYLPNMSAEILRDLLKKKDDLPTIAVVHALSEYNPSEKIQSFFNEIIMDYRDLVFDGCLDVYVMGHYHKDQGIQEHFGVKFVNLGSISRGALNIENIDRKPKVSSIKVNSQGVSIEEFIIPHGDAKDIFDFEKKTVAETKSKSMAEFFNKLKSSSSMTGGEDIRERFLKFMSSDFSQDLKDIVKEILDQASGIGA